MTKKIFLSVITAFLCKACFSQNTGLSVTASAGGVSKSENFNFQWTLGEFAIESIHSDKILLTQGFNQPGSMTAVKMTGGTGSLSMNSNIKVLPNPFHNELNIAFQNPVEETYWVTITDEGGRKIFARQINPVANLIKIGALNFPSGYYWVSIYTKESKLISTFPVLKN